MQTFSVKRLEIFIETAYKHRLTKMLLDQGITGYSVLPTLSGSGDSGEWQGSGQLGPYGSMVAVICLTRPDRIESLLEALKSVLNRQMGVVSISDCEVLRLEKF